MNHPAHFERVLGCIAPEARFTTVVPFKIRLWYWRFAYCVAWRPTGPSERTHPDRHGGSAFFMSQVLSAKENRQKCI